MFGGPSVCARGQASDAAAKSDRQRPFSELAHLFLRLPHVLRWHVGIRTLRHSYRLPMQRVSPRAGFS